MRVSIVGVGELRLKVLELAPNRYAFESGEEFQLTPGRIVVDDVYYDFKGYEGWTAIYLRNGAIHSVGRKSDVATGWQQGYNAHKNEVPRGQNPYRVGSTDYKNWDKGWAAAYIPQG